VILKWEGDPEELGRKYDRELEHPVPRNQPRRRSHTCALNEDGMVIADIWESAEDFQAMLSDSEFQKNIDAVQMPDPHSVEVYELRATIP
jgi:hypothetical protein